MLELINVTKNYSNTGTILGNINMTIECHDFIVLYGPSAVGKTTLLNLIAGLDEVTGGSINWHRDIIEPKIGYQFQNYEATLFPWLSNRTNIELPIRLEDHLSKDFRNRRVDEVIKRLNLGIPLESYPFRLSGGGKQKVALARSLVSYPDILLLDEPFNSLDLNDREHMQEEIVRIWHELGLTIIFVTHDLSEALLVGNKIYVLGGRPGHVVGESIKIDLPYPRGIKTKMMDDYFELQKKIIGYFNSGKQELINTKL